MTAENTRKKILSGVGALAGFLAFFLVMTIPLWFYPAMIWLGAFSDIHAP